MTAVARPPRGMVGPSVASVAASVGETTGEYVGRHRRDAARARHVHAAAAMLAVVLAWIPAAGGGHGRHRR